MLGYLGQVVKLALHDLAAADGAVQDALVEDAPELGRTRSVQNGLSGQPGGYLLLQVLQVAVGAGGQDRSASVGICSASSRGGRARGRQSVGIRADPVSDGR